MKVVFITAESYIDHSYTIARELKKHIDFPVFIQAKQKTPEIEKWCKSVNAEFLKRRRFRNPFSFISEIKFMFSLRKMKADLHWFNTLTVYQVFLVKLFIKKFIVTVHDVEKHPQNSQHHASFSLRLTFALLKRNICVASRSQAEIFRSRFGFDTKVFQLPIIDYFTDAAPKSEKPPVSEKIRFFFFGSVEQYKGIEILIEAAEILEKRGALFSLGIFGKLKYNAVELKEKISKVRSIELKDDFVEYNKVREIYNQNGVLLLPYKQVTQCGPLLIGYNELTPAICNNLPGFREYTDSEKSALVFNNTAVDLADKMGVLINAPGKIAEMKEYIGSEINKKFSIQSLAQEYINNFESSSQTK